MTKPAFHAQAATKLATMVKSDVVDRLAISASIKSLALRGRTMDVDLHATAVAAIYASMNHGDATAAQRLVNSMGKSARAKALVAWFHAFSNVYLTKADGGDYKAGMLNRNKHKQFKPSIDPAAAMAKPFWSVEEKSVDPAAFTDDAFAKALAKLLARANGDGATLSAKGKAKVAAIAKLIDA